MAHGFVYKIGESFPTASAAPLPVSDLDRKDGFIHMSTAEQVPATVGRFFKACKAIELLKIPIARVADRVKWESSSNHGIFPHLYGDLSHEDVVARKRYALGAQDEGWEALLKADHQFLEP